ncbi:MAG: site-specific tyrosine recombinase/integron integrase [Bacilli bacterium]
MKYINMYIDYLRVVRNYSDKTILSYYDDLTEYNEFLGNNFITVLDINDDLVSKYLKYLYERRINKNSISRKLSSIRGFYNYLVKENIVKTNYFNEVSNPKRELYLPKFLKNEEIDKIFSVCNSNNVYEERDTLIIELLYATGLRVSELVNIKIEDIDFNNRTIKVLGKGSKERMVIYNNHTKKAMDTYLNDGYHSLNKRNNGYLILNKDGNKLSERYVRNIINKLVRRANLDIKISPHTIRHTFATDMLENGSDLMTVKELLGHESLNTTSIYTHVTNEQIKKVYESAHPRAIKK